MFLNAFLRSTIHIIYGADWHAASDRLLEELDIRDFVTRVVVGANWYHPKLIAMFVATLLQACPGITIDVFIQDAEAKSKMLDMTTSYILTMYEMKSDDSIIEVLHKDDDPSFVKVLTPQEQMDDYLHCQPDILFIDDMRFRPLYGLSNSAQTCINAGPAREDWYTSFCVTKMHMR